MGTSNGFLDTLITATDHPHAYGDKLFKFNVFSLYSGSSPRVWGQVKMIENALCQSRIIPTRMGTSLLPQILYKGGGSSPRVWGQMTQTLDSLYSQDHPHAYGDKIIKRKCFMKATGSSPRVWGQAFCRYSVTVSVRIIPTRMGTSACQLYPCNSV